MKITISPLSKQEEDELFGERKYEIGKAFKTKSQYHYYLQHIYV
jgi:hypothetical protein